MRRALTYAGWISFSLTAGVIGSLLTARGLSDWYPTLRKPAWTPPGVVFGPVWMVLYVTMGVAAARVWLGADRLSARGAFGWFGLQWLLNAAWSGLFFGLRSPGWAFVEILALFGAATASALAFARHDRISGLLMLPYLAWLLFASALNGAIWRLNA
jgi:tryptophan-rich sensory protein